jgi:hypothetical protein
MEDYSGVNPVRDSAVNPEFHLPSHLHRYPGRNLRYYPQSYLGDYLQDDSQGSLAGNIPMSVPDYSSISPLPRPSVSVRPLVRYDDLPHSSGLSLRLGVSHEVHAGVQGADVVRAGTERHDAAAIRREEGGVRREE